MPYFSILFFSGLAALPEPVAWRAVPEPEALRAEAVLAHSPVRGLMQALLSRPELSLSIGHAGGDAGTTRAEALRAALVALGLPSARVVLLPQPQDIDVLLLAINPGGEQKP